MKVLGIDIGGSGIKAAIVNTKNGELLSERHRIETPKPATPKAVAKAVKEMVSHFDWKELLVVVFLQLLLMDNVNSNGNLSERMDWC